MYLVAQLQLYVYVHICDVYRYMQVQQCERELCLIIDITRYYSYYWINDCFTPSDSTLDRWRHLWTTFPPLGIEKVSLAPDDFCWVYMYTRCLETPDGEPLHHAVSQTCADSPGGVKLGIMGKAAQFAERAAGW